MLNSFKHYVGSLELRFSATRREQLTGLRIQFLRLAGRLFIVRRQIARWQAADVSSREKVQRLRAEMDQETAEAREELALLHREYDRFVSEWDSRDLGPIKDDADASARSARLEEAMRTLELAIGRAECDESDQELAAMDGRRAAEISLSNLRTQESSLLTLLTRLRTQYYLFGGDPVNCVE